MGHGKKNAPTTRIRRPAYRSFPSQFPRMWDSRFWFWSRRFRSHAPTLSSAPHWNLNMVPRQSLSPNLGGTMACALRKTHPYQFGFRHSIDKRLCSGIADFGGHTTRDARLFCSLQGGQTGFSFFPSKFFVSIFPYYNCKRTGVLFGWFRRLSSVSVPSIVEAEGARPRGRERVFETRLGCLHFFGKLFLSGPGISPHGLPLFARESKRKREKLPR